MIHALAMQGFSSIDTVGVSPTWAQSSLEILVQLSKAGADHEKSNAAKFKLHTFATQTRALANMDGIILRMGKWLADRLAEMQECEKELHEGTPSPKRSR